MADGDFTPEQREHVGSVSEAKTRLGMVPGPYRASLARYLDLGMKPGPFLCAAIENDFARAVAHFGDDTGSTAAMRSVALWLINYAPPQAWGSREKRLSWQDTVSELFARSSELPPEPQPEVTRAP